MKKVTKQQIKILFLLYPGSLGLGMKVVDVAKKLKISREAVYKQLKSIKKKFPEFWEQYLTARKIMRRDRINLKHLRVGVDDIVPQFEDQSNREEILIDGQKILHTWS